MAFVRDVRQCLVECHEACHLAVDVDRQALLGKVGGEIAEGLSVGSEPIVFGHSDIFVRKLCHVLSFEPDRRQLASARESVHLLLNDEQAMCSAALSRPWSVRTTVITRSA